MSFIPYGKQEILQEDINSVIDVLKSPFITQGPKVSEFEEKIAKYVYAKYAVSTNSATSALHIACLSLGLKKGDFLWTSPISFVASSNCGIYCGAKIDFIDIDPKTYNIDINYLESKLKKTKKSKLPKIIIAVHFAGQSCDMEALHKLSLRYGFKIIEDASHALGGEYKGNKIGGCRYSDISIFSFHPVKPITTSEGGIATTNNQALAKKMKILRSHGITKDIEDFDDPKKDSPWYYEQQILGFNYRLNDISATLGISQLNRLDSYTKKRNKIAEKYNKHLEHLELKTPFIESYNYSAYHLYPILLTKNSGISRKKLVEKFLDSKIGVQIHYIPIHLQPFYARFGFKKGDFKEAEQYYKNTISLPIFPNLSDDEQDKVIKVLKKCVAKK